jgi:sialate O-acetylesterase
MGLTGGLVRLIVGGVKNRSTRSWYSAVLLGLAFSAPGFSKPTTSFELRFDPVFADHAVLQRDQRVPLWGHAKPNARVQVHHGEWSSSTLANKNGDWTIMMPARRAATPAILTISTADGQRQTLQDVALGDVFLCSGQSNMEWSMAQGKNAEQALARANDPLLRIATIPQRSASSPLPSLEASLDWARSTPAHARDFSAVCWFMGQQLRQRLKVPIGLIDASYGGSTIQAWLGPVALATGGDPDAKALLQLYNEKPEVANLLWGERWKRWWVNNASGTDTPWLDFGSVGWSRIPIMALWEQWPKPIFAEWNGLVWYRTRLTLTPDQASQAATLNVGAIDEFDQTWVNGRAVGSGAGDQARHYPVPSGALHPGDNVITIAIVDTWAEGGPYGDNKRRALTLADGTVLPLSGEWTYRHLQHPRPRPPRPPWFPTSGQGTLYNGMIAPLRQYGIRAMAWYQGESNSEDGLGYRDRLQALYTDRRRSFGAGLPIVIIQLANFGKIPEAPVESDWAALREAQRRQVIEDHRSGLVVTIDVGDPLDIHPRDKQTVGMRLADRMMVVAYGIDGARAGPQPSKATRTGRLVSVRFTEVKGTLSGADEMFELCGTDFGSCRREHATLRGNEAVLRAKATDTRVRYCWGDSPICTLRDAEGPLGPFEIGIE